MAERAQRGQSVPGYQRMADELRARIVNGQLLPGEQLPPEAELTEQFGVSRSTMREALRTLSSQNLLVTTRGVTGGTFVAEPSPDAFATFLETSLGLLSRQHISVSQLLEVRMLLEVPAAGLAAQRRSPESSAALRATIVPVRSGTPAQRWAANSRFHTALLESVDNPLLTMVTSPVFAVLRNQVLRDRANRSFWQQVSHDHEGIADAVAGGHRRKAETLMREHLENLRDTYEDIENPGAH